MLHDYNNASFRTLNLVSIAKKKKKTCMLPIRANLNINETLTLFEQRWGGQKGAMDVKATVT